MSVATSRLMFPRFLTGARLMMALVFWCLFAALAGHNAAAQTPTPAPWRALDLATATDNNSRLLWLTPQNAFSVWNIDPAGGHSGSSPLFTPVAGWQARALSVGGDGLTRVLRTHLDGRATIWTLSAGLQQQGTAPEYGPYTNWTALDLAVGADNSTRLLWSHSDGSLSLWNISPTGVVGVSPTYAGNGAWRPQALAVAGDGTSRVLWTHVDGMASVWVVNADGTQQSILPTSGPFTGWTATDIAANAGVPGDLKCRLLWKRSDGQAALWRLSDDGSVLEVNGTFGPYAGWQA